MQELKRFLNQNQLLLIEVLHTLKIFLVCSKVYLIEATVDSSKCGSKRCQVCLRCFSEADIFESFQTKRLYKINNHLNCNDKCLIYLVLRHGLQYVGSTRKHSGVKRICNQNYWSIFIQRNMMGFCFRLYSTERALACGA